MKKIVVYIGISNIFLSGCTNMLSAPTAEWPWTSGACVGDSCTNAEVLNNFNKASKFCREVQNYYENGGQRTNNAKLTIGGVGTLAGSVIAPTASGSAATAWSGLSGAANAFQVSIDEAFSASVAVKRRKAVSAAATAGAAAIIAEPDANKKVQLSIQMAMNCSISSATADQETLKALSQ